ncbi:SCP2 sterol-binding domain-containing protein [Dasania sp. GY-MA-18]|uniref:Ubiquinone biosynthesis accessory factor UbiJ n=1 Tax=Dasania phycosphaerae TaxID=2950436 RepID=A0A9J6RKZ5_9GAMM|nr:MULTISPECIES: SCP2 sterol-binding domain-containing protein [Dasania]MCR8922427.1 SCP2 sterol-binding domain-containing protein [Dasania sp. GY-MA-18]MCZ0864855.1 SCP2 sterol-binding domain-containing protein [Dasania phycosphaerae]MCZ0868583.1 SCP2 sterol-binding domain-containing protein [Dasania phycosphaerae]
MISPTLHTAGLAGLEAAINKALSLDPASQQKLRLLNGHVFQLQLTSPELSFYCIPGSHGLRLCGYYEDAADTKLSGTASEFFKLATASDPANALINGKLELHGDSSALIELQKIGQQLELDWEAPLVNVFGDVAGHMLADNLRKGFSFASQAFKSFKRQTEEYIKEESDLLAPRWQVEQFYREVENLQLRSERLAARINKLTQQKTQG